jgi:hypothetical protein
MYVVDLEVYVPDKRTAKMLAQRINELQFKSMYATSLGVYEVDGIHDTQYNDTT